MLTRQELTQISATLYERADRLQNLTLRRFVRTNTSYAEYLRAVGYDVIDTKGEARVRQAGSQSKDRKYVGEERSQEIQPTYDVDAYIKYNDDELAEYRQAAATGTRAAVPVQQYRIRTARRVVDEAIDKIGFIGAPDGQVQGILNYARGDRRIQVIENPVKKKPKFKEMTPFQMLGAILELRDAAKYKNIYNPSVLAITPDIESLFSRPMHEQNTETVIQWFRKQSNFPQNIIVSRALEADLNGDDYATDVIMMLDPNPDWIELSLLRDLQMSQPRQTDFHDWEIEVRSKTGGILLREPESVAVMHEI